MANPKGAKDKLQYDLLMPDPRLALTTYPWHAADELRIEWCESNGAGFSGYM